MRKLLAIWICLFGGFCSAGEVRDLYSATVEAENSQTRNASNALKQVLIKVSGDRDILDNPLIRTQLRSAQDLVLSFAFTTDQQTRLYRARFDDAKVQTLIKNAGFPLWPAVRPHTLIWLAEQTDAGDRQILTETDGQPGVSGIHKQARNLGLDISLPIGDITDLQALSVFDVWGRFEYPIRQASERYKPDLIVVARITQNQVDENSTAEPDYFAEPTELQVFEGDWLIQWQVLNGPSPNQIYTLANDDKTALITAFTEELASQQAKTFSIDTTQSPEQRQSIALIIHQVNGIVAYQRALEYLEQLTAVNSATVSSVKGNSVHFRLSMLGTEEDIRNAITLGNQLQPLRDQFGFPVPQLEFVWVE